MFLYISAKNSCGDDEKIERCPFCSYYFYALKKNTANFFYCRNEDCGKDSCNICKKEIPKVTDDYDEDEELYE